MSSLVSRFVRKNRDVCESLARHFPQIFRANSYVPTLRDRIERELEHSKSVLEVGGIDRPFLERGSGYIYDGMDIEHRDSCSKIYDSFLVQSIEERIPAVYDMIISVTLLEHVANNDAALLSIFEALAPGGTTHHYVPSRNHPYALILRLVGPVWQKRIIRTLRPAEVDVTGYPTYFDHCSPTLMRRAFDRAGFMSVSLKPFYRANDYFAFFVPAYLGVTLFEKVCEHYNIEAFASGFVVSAARSLP